jgi:hypothetical protein
VPLITASATSRAVNACGNSRRGRRPSFDDASTPAVLVELQALWAHNASCHFSLMLCQPGPQAAILRLL